MITLCLVMIVKNESKVIRRCLNSVIDYLDSYCICDTGSTDDTCKIIKDFFKERGIKGKLLHHDWKNFGHNRTLAVQAAKGMGDYLLLMDADFVFKPKNKLFKQKPWQAGSLLIKYEGLLDYRQPLMVRGEYDWKYIGVTHEYIHCPNTTRAKCDDFVFQHVGDGANKDNKFERDIELLTEGIKDEPDNMRYYFYLAQSQKDLAGSIKQKYSLKKRSLDNMRKNKENEKTKKILLSLMNEVNKLEQEYKFHFQEAINAYSTRIKKHDFAEEIYYSMYMIGHCHYHMGSNSAIFLGWFLEAHAFRPNRLESLYQIVKYYRMKKKYRLSYDLGRRGADQAYPKNDCLFIDSRIHEYLLKHEVAISAFYLGEFEECMRLLKIVLANPDLSPGHRQAVEQHRKMTERKLVGREQVEVRKKTDPNRKPMITFFSYNLLGTGGSEISDWGLLRYLSKECGYIIKHSRDYREIIQDQPDIILAQQHAIEKGVEIGDQLGIPVIVSLHGPSQWGHARRNNYFIFNSYHIAEMEIPRTSFEHFDIVYPRIDTTKFDLVGENWRAEMNNDGERKYLTFIGRPKKLKGIETFFAIAREMPEHQFLFVGGKPSPEEGIEEEMIPSNVEIRDFTKEPEKIYAISKLVIVPSHYEAFGMVAIEASLCGVPVVATGLPGIREATSNMSNYVNTFDQVEPWVEKIQEILEDDEYQLQVKNAFKIGETYQESNLDQMNRFKYNVERILDGKKPCPYTRGLCFSVTLTVYNRADLVIRAMQSVIAQTYTNWEMIVVDDCSTDDTWEKLCAFHREHCDYRIRLVQNEKNQGTFYSRNIGIVEAEGDFVINLDSDDLLVPSALDRLKDWIWKTDARIVQFKFFRATGNEVDLENLDTIVDDPKFRDGKGSSWGLFCFEKNYVVEHVGYYDPIRYGADTEFMCRLKNFHRVENLDAVLYYAADTKESLSTKIKSEWSNQYLRNFMKWYQETKKKGEQIYITFDPSPTWEYIRPFEYPKD